MLYFLRKSVIIKILIFIKVIKNRKFCKGKKLKTIIIYESISIFNLKKNNFFFKTKLLYILTMLSLRNFLPTRNF